MLLLKAGELFDDKYLIAELIGQGGMGDVYRATHLEANRQVAVKVLRFNERIDEKDRERFFREFKTISRLHHEHIMSFYNFAISQEGLLYAVCEYIDGRSLKAVINDTGKLPWQRTVGIAIQICDAMQHAHSSGVIHRDLKPDNVMLTMTPEPDFVKLIDFGLTKTISNTVEQSKQLTLTGQLLGTPQYMSPEQCAGMPATATSDVYSLGCVIFEMLTEEKLFPPVHPLALLHLHRNASVEEQLASLSSYVPYRMIEVLRKMLAKIPEQRYASMADLRDELQLLQDNETLHIVKVNSQPGWKNGKLSHRTLSTKLWMAALVALPMSLLLLPHLGHHQELSKIKFQNSAFNSYDFDELEFSHLSSAKQTIWADRHRQDGNYRTALKMMRLALRSKKLRNEEEIKLLNIGAHCLPPDERIPFICRELNLISRGSSNSDLQSNSHYHDELVNLGNCLRTLNLSHQALRVFEDSNYPNNGIAMGIRENFGKTQKFLRMIDAQEDNLDDALVVSLLLKHSKLNEARSYIMNSSRVSRLCSCCKICLKYHQLDLAKICLSRAKALGANGSTLTLMDNVSDSMGAITSADAFLNIELGKKKEAAATIMSLLHNIRGPEKAISNPSVLNVKVVGTAFVNDKDLEIIQTGLILCDQALIVEKMISSKFRSDTTNVSREYFEILQELKANGVLDLGKDSATRRLMESQILSPEDRCKLTLLVSKQPYVNETNYVARAYGITLVNAPKIDRSLKLRCMLECMSRLSSTDDSSLDSSTALPVEALRIGNLISTDLEKNGLPAPSGQGQTAFGRMEALRVKLNRVAILGMWGQYTEAERAISEIESLDLPDEDTPWDLLLDTELSLGRMPQARQIIQKCRKLKHLRLMARICYKWDKLELARFCLERAKSLQDNSSLAERRILAVDEVYLALEEGDIPRAKKLLSKLIQTDISNSNQDSQLAVNRELLNALYLSHMDDKASEISKLLDSSEN